MSMSRRSFLRSSAAAAGAVAASSIASSISAGLVHAEPGATSSADAAGTTLAKVGVAGRPDKKGYRKLVEGRGWPLYVREELAAARPRRDSTRTGLASFVQLTDIHITDVQSPARFEYVHPLQGPAYRPQEALGTQAAVALVKRINALSGGPFTARAFDCVVSTGDNTDNHEIVELEWYQRLLAGGKITPNTGHPTRFEGVQSDGSAMYYRPEIDTPDQYKDRGFPTVPGLLHAAIRAHVSPGLNMRWYSVFGNHDDQMVGTVPNNLIDWLYLGDAKFDLPGTDPTVGAIANALGSAPSSVVPLLAKLKATGPLLPATADPRRRPYSPREFVRRHFDPSITGAGPVGHGFADPDGPSWYRFQIAPGVLGIAMNTTNSLGIADGSISQKQLDWISKQIRAHADHLVIVFSHHTSTTMTARLPNPETPGQAQFDGKHLVERLKAHPNVIAWVNGHTHNNAVTPHRGSTPEHSFWEINTASHIDFPQLARIIEVADNKDGTISVFTPLIEADGPYTADPSNLTQQGLASLYREFSLNDIHLEDRAGTAADRNCELLLANPLR
ncbi:TIGR03767 family metallophosphoesterase [Gordonia sp. (in: high G+C Gram-positive bacteria)]|uniref:TIGR03767 family metallophosphoesterase n=1 Tax=Gordonia sp. (in: high G+C Gram-positive bacteria) TaxID=84139 RepID=UPI003F963254